MSEVWAGYVRRSVKEEDDADISDKTQREAIIRRVPDGAEIEWFVDMDVSGGSDQRREYQRMLEWLATGRLLGIAAYDDSRLNRQAIDALTLFKLCAERGVLLRVDESRAEAAVLFGDPSQHTMYGMRALFSQQERERIRKRGRDGSRQEFESGGPRGADPFGYKTARVWSDRKQAFLPRREDGVARVLEIVPEEASVVERLFRELAHRTFAETAEIFNAEGVPSPTPAGWSAGATRAFWDRRWFYAGFVTLGHSGRRSARRDKLDVERRPGKHEPILTEDVFRDAVAGVEGRRSGISKPKKHHRMYLLAGRLFCRCGARMRGEPRVSKAGRLYRYYACPVSDKRGVKPDADGKLATCDQKRVPAEEAEAAVIERMATGVLPAAAIDAAREDLRQRLKAPKPGLSDQKRKRLQTRLEQIRKLVGWGDMADEEYLREKEAIERELVMLPDSDKLRQFDGQRKVIVSMAENLRRATPAQTREFVLLLVERAVAYDRAVQEVRWSPPARPFFDQGLGEGFVVLARPAGLEPTTFRSAT